MKLATIMFLFAAMACTYTAGASPTEHDKDAPSGSTTDGRVPDSNEIRIPSPTGNVYAAIESFTFYLPLGAWYNDDEKTKPYGQLWIVSGTNAMGVPWVRRRVGVTGGHPHILNSK